MTTRMDSLTVRGFLPQWTLGDRLRKSREAIGLKQSELAEEIGVSKRSLVYYESGEVTPKRPVLLAWCMACDVDSGWLLTGEVPEGYVPGDNTSLPPASAAASHGADTAVTRPLHRIVRPIATRYQDMSALGDAA